MREGTEGVRITGGASWRLGSFVNRARIAAKDLADEIDQRRTAAAGPTVADRQAELVEFYNRFEGFVEILCDSAQYGPNPRLERNYLEERTWLSNHFGNLRSYVGAFLPADEPDAFDRLFAAEDLGDFLNEDDGAVIFRITNTREALSHYAEHLRQLNARKSA